MRELSSLEARLRRSPGDGSPEELELLIDHYASFRGRGKDRVIVVLCPADIGAQSRVERVEDIFG